MFKKHPENKIKHSILKIVYIYREVCMQNSSEHPPLLPQYNTDIMS